MLGVGVQPLTLELQVHKHIPRQTELGQRFPRDLETHIACFLGPRLSCCYQQLI